MEGLEPRVVQDPIWSNADAERRVTQKGSDRRRCDFGSMALKRRACPCATAGPQGDLNEGNRDGEIKKSVMMGFSRNYDGLFYKTSGRKNQTMKPLRTLLLGKEIVFYKIFYYYVGEFLI
jgi:hypothetical protein